jgi:adenylate cyclase
MSAKRGNALVRFLKEARRRHVHSTAAVYIAVALVLMQLSSSLFGAIGQPGAANVFTLILFLLFPLVLALSWMFDVRGGIVRSDWFDDAKQASTPEKQRASAALPVNRPAPPPEKPRAPTPALDVAAAPAPERVQRATLAHIRHELKTPINAIIGYSEMLLEDAPKGEAAADLKRIRSAGQQLLSAVEHILDPEHAGAELRDYGERIRSDLRDPINAVIGYCEMLIETSLNESTVSDLERIRTSALRLLDLSTDIIQIATGASDGGRFGSVSALTETVLAKVRPLDVASAEDRQGVLLVVDDNPMNRDLLSRQLARKGYEVVIADSGVAALKELDEHTFDLVLLDIIMPGMDGIEVLRRIREQSRLDDVGVIMTSSLDEIDSVVRCLENGAADYVTKPFDPTLLDARIGACLKLRRLRQREEYYRQQLETRDALVERVALGALPAAIAKRAQGSDVHIIDQCDDVTVLWCDLDRLLHGDARTSATEAAVRMRGALALLQESATRHGVELTALLGGGMLLASGIPTACADHAERVADTVTAVLPALRELAGTDTFPLRFGMHSGSATATVLGDERLCYHIWGDAVDVARKLEARADPGTIHISTTSHAALKDRFDFAGRGVMDVGGRQMRTWTINEGVAAVSS